MGRGETDGETRKGERSIDDIGTDTRIIRNEDKRRTGEPNMANQGQNVKKRYRPDEGELETIIIDSLAIIIIVLILLLAVRP